MLYIYLPRQEVKNRDYLFFEEVKKPLKSSERSHAKFTINMKFGIIYGKM